MRAYWKLSLEGYTEGRKSKGKPHLEYIMRVEQGFHGGMKSLAEHRSSQLRSATNHRTDSFMMMYAIVTGHDGTFSMWLSLVRPSGTKSIRRSLVLLEDCWNMAILSMTKWTQTKSMRPCACANRVENLALFPVWKKFHILRRYIKVETNLTFNDIGGLQQFVAAFVLFVLCRHINHYLLYLYCNVRMYRRTE